MSKRPNKIKSIDIIVEHINSGKTYSQSLKFFVDNWGVPESTFTNYWNEAKEVHQKQREAIKKAEMEERIRLGKEAVKREIMTRNEVLETLTKLGKGEAWKVGSEIIAPTASERINAMKEISRMQGYYEPEKVEVKGGLDLEVNASKVVKDILKKLND